jgi:DNA-binding NarL/FixJ family response regulator
VQRIRVFIVDDHPPIREGLKAMLAEEEDLFVCGEAGDATETLWQITDAAPDIVLLDISLHGENAFGLIREMQAKVSDAKVVMLSMHNGFEYIRQAVSSGARGYLSKESSADRVFEAIRRVHAGEYYLDSFALAPFVQALLNAPPDALLTDDGRYSTLSRREQEIFRKLAEGQTCKEIGSGLFISAKTVENHRSNVMKKLDLSSHVELYNYARSLGIID